MATALLILLVLAHVLLLAAVTYLLVGAVFALYCHIRSPANRPGHTTADFFIVMMAWPFFAWAFYKMGFGL